MNAYLKGLADRHRAATSGARRASGQSIAALGRQDLAAYQQWRRVVDIRWSLCEKIRKKVTS